MNHKRSRFALGIVNILQLRSGICPFARHGLCSTKGAGPSNSSSTVCEKGLYALDWWLTLWCSSNVHFKISATRSIDHGGVAWVDCNRVDNFGDGNSTSINWCRENMKGFIFASEKKTSIQVIGLDPGDAWACWKCSTICRHSVCYRHHDWCNNRWYSHVEMMEAVNGIATNLS